MLIYIYLSICCLGLDKQRIRIIKTVRFSPFGKPDPERFRPVGEIDT